MRWIAWTVVLAAGLGVLWALLSPGALTTSEHGRTTSERRDGAPEPRPVDGDSGSERAVPDRGTDPASPGIVARVRALAGLAGHEDADASAAGSEGRTLALRSGPPGDLEEELRRAERALATSRRSSTPESEADAASSDVLARAVSGASAEALGCGRAGSACGSSADCCPSLACVGGIGGYGTPGRCESPR